MGNRKTKVINVDTLNKYVDLDRYPIYDLDCSAGQALIARARQKMQSSPLSPFPAKSAIKAAECISNRIVKWSRI